jgi:hypothetical protein
VGRVVPPRHPTLLEINLRPSHTPLLFTIGQCLKKMGNCPDLGMRLFVDREG